MRVTARTGGLDPRSHTSDEWVDFKCRVMTDFVGEARDGLKGRETGRASWALFIVPDVDGLTEALTGQRLRDLAPFADLVAPMLYHNILLRPPDWIGEVLA